MFVNLYYEYNNPELDASGSNLKCVAFSDTHTAVEKTDFGGLQLEPKPAGTTYIQQSARGYRDQYTGPEVGREGQPQAAKFFLVCTYFPLDYGYF